MSIFSLLGRIALNTKPLEEGLDRAEKKASSFADRVEHKVGKKLDKAFGAGLITGAVISQFHQFFELFTGTRERAAHIQELMDKYKLGAESVQALEMAAKEAHQPLEEFIKTISETGGIDATIARIRALRKEVVLTGEDVDNFGNQEGWEQNVRDSADKAKSSSYKWFLDLATQMFATADIANQGKTTANTQADVAADLAEQKRQDRLNRAKQAEVDDETLRTILTSGKKPESISGTGKRAASLTSWQQVGAFIGTSGDVLVREQQKNTAVLLRIEQLTRQQLEAMNKSGRDPFL